MPHPALFFPQSDRGLAEGIWLSGRRGRRMDDCKITARRLLFRLCPCTCGLTHDRPKGRAPSLGSEYFTIRARGFQLSLLLGAAQLESPIGDQETRRL